MPVRELVLELAVRHEPAALEIYQEHTAGLETPLRLHVLGVDRHDADLARHDHAVVVGEVIAARTQAVAVEHRADVLAVRECDRRGPVPRLHQAGVELVERALVLRHQLVLLPSLGDHHHHGFREAAARHHQELEHVVERTGVGAIGLDDREESLERISEQFAAHDALASPHPVLVAAQRVDLAVVRHQPVGLRAVPARERVRREPRMDHREMRLVVGVVEVGIEVLELPRGKHALVDERGAREAANVELLRLTQRMVAAQLVARALADQVELALERIALEAVAGCDEHVLDLRHRRASRLADVGFVRQRRHASPADQPLAFLGAQVRHTCLAALALCCVRGEEHHAGRVLARRRQVDAELLLRDLREKLVRQARDDAGTVARVRLRAARAAMIHAAQQMVRIGHDLVAALALDVRDEADAAAVVLELGPIKASCRRWAVLVAVTHARCRSSPRRGRRTVRCMGGRDRRQSSNVFRICRSWFYLAVAVGSAYQSFSSGWQLRC